MEGNNPQEKPPKQPTKVIKDLKELDRMREELGNEEWESIANGSLNNQPAPTR